MLVQNEVVAIPARQTEAVEIRADPKNNIQWAEIITPVPSNLRVLVYVVSMGIFDNQMMIPSPAVASMVLKNTSSTGGISINNPRIAVNPQRIIMK
jgi:hypothetical protein